jgi:hypothetical protein
MPVAKNRVLTIWLTTCILLAFAGLDYVTPQIMRWGSEDSNWPFWMAVGGCIAQVTLIAAWAVFAPGNIVVRLPWSLLLGLMMWYVLSLSQWRTNYVHDRYHDAWHDSYVESYKRDVVQVGICLLLGVTALQLPLWITKRAFRYRMLAPGEIAAPTSTERFQFQIKHLLIGTLFLALALAPLRAVIPSSILQHINLEWRIFFAVGLAIAANLLTTLPCLWGGFVSSAKLIPLGIAWLLYCLVVTGLEFGTLCVVEGAPPPSHAANIFGLVYLANVTQGAVVLGVMRCYRALGYRLERVPRDMPPPNRLQETWEAVLVETEDDSKQAERDVE